METVDQYLARGGQIQKIPNQDHRDDTNPARPRPQQEKKPCGEGCYWIMQKDGRR